jgi:glucokinase
MSSGGWIIGVDLGGTTISVGAVSADGARQHGLRTVATLASEGADAVVGRIASQVLGVVDDLQRDLGVERREIHGVGIGSPGPLDRARGVVITTPNLGWTEFPIRTRVAEATGLDASLDNDANCATLGEWWLGAARGGRHVIGITLGTGIGGGIIVDGRMFHGASDVAAEIGHMTVDLTGRRCGCGNEGCLEAYASGPAIAARARESLEASGAASAMRDAVGGDLHKLTAQVVYAAAGNGDHEAREIVRETAEYLGVGVANLLNIFNPDVVVLAGGVAQAGDLLFEPLRSVVRRRAFKPAVDACRIVPGVLGAAAGVVGAAATFREQRGLTA